MKQFRLEVDSNGIAVITWDTPNKSMNVLSFEAYEEISNLVDEVLKNDKIKGAVLTSGKKDFAAGMDLNQIAQMKASAGENPAKVMFEGIMNGHRILRKLERAGMDPKTNKGGKPIAAALPGTALGIGMEIPLACHRIFVSDRDDAKYGLPEILVGIFPGGGGTMRMLFKYGMMHALPLLAQGKTLSPKEAKAAGYVDEVVPENELLDKAKEWALNASEDDIVKPWDKKGYKLPGGGPYHPAGFLNYVGAAAMLHGRTKGAYPAAKALISAVYEGSLTPFDTALEIEARHFTNVLMNPSSEAMIKSLFVNKQALEKGANRPKDIPDMKVKKLGVLGAGMMGAGIAYVSAKAGINVVLIDQTKEAAEKGKTHSANVLDKAIQRGKANEKQKTETLGRISPSDKYQDLKGCDLIIEAVFEDAKVKAQATQLAEAELDENAIFATNTSTLPISDLAKASRNQEKFIGIHFFSPVERMALVEIIKGKKTKDHAVAKALDYVRQIRKTPIVVNDARFFYANRCIIPYLNEGTRMLSEGIKPALIENAAKIMGMPLGPLQLADETAIDLGVRIMKATKEALGNEYVETGADHVMMHLYELKRYGKKTKAGFYEYDENGKRTQLWRGVHEKFPLAEKQPDVQEVINRLAFSQSLEAVRALENGVLTDIREGDVGAILGWGYMPWSGGPFFYLDMLGADKAVEIAKGLAQKHGPTFDPPALLQKLASKGQKFHSKGALPL